MDATCPNSFFSHDYSKDGRENAVVKFHMMAESLPLLWLFQGRWGKCCHKVPYFYFSIV